MIDWAQFAPRASGGSGPIYGVVVGEVTDNQDPDGFGRVRVRFPWLSADHASHWAPVMAAMAGDDRGLFLLPEVGNLVLVAFDQGSVEFPYVLGALWNGKDKPPAHNGGGANNVRLLKSSSGHVIALDDTAGSERIEIVDAQGKESIALDVARRTITITADHDVVIESRKGSIRLTAGEGVEITARNGSARLAAGGAVEVEGAQVDVKGSPINLN